MTRSFRATTVVGCVVGILSGVIGVATSFYADTPSGGTIVLVAIAFFIAALGYTAVRNRARRVGRSG